MYIENLKFQNFRNLRDGCINPCEGINVIYGNNAHGKTNILEALWLFCGGHSFRASRENEFIKFGEKFSKLKVKFFSQEREQEAELVFSGSRRDVIINGVRKSSSSALIGKYNAVIFSPDDLTLVKRGPSSRRRFIDSAICREKFQNAVLLAKYNQTLNQRNALLKDIYHHSELKKTLEIWDDTLCEFGSSIILQRLSYIEKLSQSACDYHLGISDNTEELKISYISTCDAVYGENKKKIFQKMRDRLNESREEDFRSGYTNVGPHRDDFDILINGRKAKIFASQGQQRSSVLSLKLAEARVLSELTGENPVILLDDVLSELDRKRQDFLLNKIKGYQVFITCCDFEINNLLREGKKFLIQNGEVK